MVMRIQLIVKEFDKNVPWYSIVNDYEIKHGFLTFKKFKDGLWEHRNLSKIDYIKTVEVQV